MRRLMAMVALMTLAAACSDATAPTTVPPAATPPPTTATTSSATTTSSTTTTTAAVSTTAAAAPEVPALVVANPDGAFLVEDDFLFQLVEGPVELAIDDGRGGLVFQRSSEKGLGDPEGTIVSYLPPDSFEPRDLLVPTGEQYLTLYDVAYGDVWYTRREGMDSPETALETLRAFDLDTGAVDEIAVTGGWESGVGEVSVGYELIATHWFAEATSGFDLRNLGGAGVGVAGDPYHNGELFCGDGELYDVDAGEFTGGGCFESPALGDDGTLAYIERDLAADGVHYVLVVAAVDTGAEILRQDLERPDQGWVPDSVEIGTDYVLINRRATGEFGSAYVEALLIDRISGERSEAAVPGRARFLIGPMAIS